MDTVILVIHLLLAVSLICVVLIQRSEGGGLGMSSGGGMGGFMSGRAAANTLTRITTILAAGFMMTSLLMAWNAGHSRESRSILDTPVPAISEPAMPSEPAAPLAN